MREAGTLKCAEETLLARQSGRFVRVDSLAAGVGLVVRPKKGRAVLMDQDILHRVSAPSLPRAAARATLLSGSWCCPSPIAILCTPPAPVDAHGDQPLPSTLGLMVREVALQARRAMNERSRTVFLTLA